MNIAIGKMGKSVKFNPAKYGAVGGDNEAPALFLLLARKNPDINFYMVGKSDLRLLKPELKEELNIPPNLIDVWEGFDRNKHNGITYAYDRLNELNVKIDYGIFYNGPASSSNIPNLLKKNDGTYCSPLEMFKNYAGPIVYYLNQSNIKYFTLGPDPRYIPIPAMDLINREQFVLSQYDYMENIKHITTLEDHTIIDRQIPISYSGIEKVFFLDREKKNITKIPKNKKMLIVLNEGGNGGLKRGPMLKEYILDNFKDIEIYGKWSDKWYEDKRFKGPKKFNELQELLSDVKYTFIIPIQKGWVTAKFWEMINYGIIPFMHPYYDQQKHIPCPDFLRVNSPEELLEKINYLEDNPEEYKKLLNELSLMLKDEYYDGTFINNLIIDGINKLKGTKRLKGEK